MERVQLDGMVFSNDAMTAGGRITKHMIHSDASFHQVSVRISMQEKNGN